jgi:hypothetical protein
LSALAFFDDEVYSLFDPYCTHLCRSDVVLTFDFVASDPDASFALDFLVAVPEPATASNVALGLVLLALARRTRARLG